jgi:leucine dehydrogenase
MTVFSHPEFDNHEKVLFGSDAESGLKAIIAIHLSTRGPALGGCRFWNYGTDEEALRDVLRLSRGMTYKSALANLPYGGGKSVIIGDPGKLKSEALFGAMGRLVDSLGGAYIVAEDVGISVEDVEVMARETDHVAGIPKGGVGDPSPATAYGVYHGIRAAVKHRLGRDDLNGLTVAVQGLGHVGQHLCAYLAEAGARLIVTDLDQERVRRTVEAYGAKAVPAGEIAFTQADVFAPCALGAIIDDASLERLRAPIVAGSANNQLSEARHGEALRHKGILYAPDYVINAGGIINIHHETKPGRPPYDKTKAFERIAGIHDTLLEIFSLAERDGVSTSPAADRLAEQRFSATPTQAAA